MKENYIQILKEEALNNMEVSLATQAISDQINDMISKLTNLKIKDIADLVQKIKFDDSVDKANDFQNMMVEKIDSILDTMTEVKGSIDDYVAKSMKGEDTDLSSEFGSEDSEEGSDMDFEFNPDAEDEEMSEDDLEKPDVKEPTLDKEKISSDLKELERKLKK